MAKQLDQAKVTNIVETVNTQVPSYLDVLAKYGIDEISMRLILTMRERGTPTPEQCNTAILEMEELAKKITDQEGFVTNWLGTTKKFEIRTGILLLNLLRGNESTNVQINGETATATRIQPGQ